MTGVFLNLKRKGHAVRSVHKRVFILLFASFISLSAFAQIQPKSLVTQRIDESNLVALRGSVRPLTQGAKDRGIVSDSFAAGRMLLLLNRPPEREAALKQFLRDVNTRGSASYHKWLTPEEFGKQFGAANGDIETAGTWLASHGLQISKVAKSRQFIEFSGTAGALRSAFHTEIHQYEVKGATHYANATAVKIPAALAGLVKGVTPLNDFHAQPQLHVLGEGEIAHGHKSGEPLWTAPNQYGTSNPYEFTVTPEDLATQYDLAPLYQAGVNGSGQTIGIINESNIDLGLVQDYQKLFGVNGGTPQVVIDGDDPGDLQGIDVEAYLDVEVSGAMAPKATVSLYIASGGALIDPLELAAVRAVEDNQASVLSVSFGACEYALGAAGNQFWSSLWEQAAAQGQTVLVSAGDSGSVCFPSFPQYPAVSGLASTPWNIAVGGTDFYYSDYASGGTSATSLWNTTNDANLGSLKAPLTEQAWDDPFGFNVIADSIQRGERAAGGGGASDCITQDASNLQYPCTGGTGYAKPSWQSGPGVPADGARDIPDVSLFASNGANLSAYAVCAFASECAAGSGESAQVLLVGGTSASAPAMAGILALVNQKYGRQGQANYTLYPLAQQKPAAFHDITQGGNYQYCGNASTASSNPDCELKWNGYYGSKLDPAGPGYDMATGLGSVDGAALVNNWNAIAFQPTATTLQLSSNRIVHGTPVTITASVAPSSGSGTPTGNVAVLADVDLPASAGQTAIPLSNGAGTTTYYDFPGGEYQITGRYGGDGTFASSTSQPVSLTVTPETSNIHFSLTDSLQKIAAGGSVAYNSPLQLNIQPVGVDNAGPGLYPPATGSGNFTLDSTTATVALNSAGTASWMAPGLPVGTHTASASYSGDASYKPSSATPVTFSVTPNYPYRRMNIVAAESTSAPEWDLNPGSSITVEAIVGADYGLLTGRPAQPGIAAPTGTVTICLNTGSNVGGQPCANMPAGSYSSTANLSSPAGLYDQYSTATVTFTNLAAGYYMPQFWYSGDSNWNASGEYLIAYVNVQTKAAVSASTTTLSVSPTSISGTQEALLTATVTGSGSSGTAPTGVVDYFNGGNFFAYSILLPASTGGTSSAAVHIDSAQLWNNGANQITAIYLGDANYGSSTSNVVNLTTDQAGVGDFTLAAQAPQVTVKSGSTGSVGVNLAAVNNFSANLALVCAPSSSRFSCSVTPASTMLNGAVGATVTISATLPGVTSASVAPAQGQTRGGWLGAGTVLAASVLLWFPIRRRRWTGMVCLSILAAVALVTVGCGGSGNSGGGSNPPPVNGTPAGRYTVVVTGTANGIVHNAVIGVLVQQ